MTETSERLETKAEAGGEMAGMLGEFAAAFEEFKRTNDQRLDEIEKRGAADALIEDKLERLNRVLDGHRALSDRKAVERARPAIESARGAGRPDEHKQAFSDYVKRGETKALNIGVPEEGGYVVPDEVETEITRLLTAVSPIRAIAGVRQVSGAVYRRPVSVSGAATGWVGETAARPETDAPELEVLNYPTAELYAMPAATSTFLEDAAVDVGQWIAEEVNAAFAVQETTAFVTGNGTSRPLGLLAAGKAPEAGRDWDELGYVPTGVAGGLPATTPSDVLIDLVYALKAGYRQNASWVMNRSTQRALRKLKDQDGNYLWQPAIAADGRASLMGFPVVEAEDMPDIAANAFPIAFGDFRRGYLIVDRRGVSVLRDPYSSKPYVLFYTTKRVGGGVADHDAIKLLKIGVS